MRLSPKQNATIVAFARSHYDRIRDLVVHQLTKNNIGRKTLVRYNENKFSINFTYYISVYVTLSSNLQRIRYGFHQHVNVPSSGRLSLMTNPLNHAYCNWSKDRKGRLVLEKEGWNKFALQANIRIGSVILFCFTMLHDRFGINFQELWELIHLSGSVWNISTFFLGLRSRWDDMSCPCRCGY